MQTETLANASLPSQRSPAWSNDELQLFVRIGREDQAAFRQSRVGVQPRSTPVLNMLKDHARAEEVVVVRCTRSGGIPTVSAANPSFPPGPAVGIARRKALMVYRARRPTKRTKTWTTSPRSPPRTCPTATPSWRQAGAPRGRAALRGKLSDEHRECLHLVFFEGMGVAEVAAIRNCPEGTVKTRLFHARQKIKNCPQALLRWEGGAPTAKGAPAS